jgi:hypothetical protein
MSKDKKDQLHPDNINKVVKRRTFSEMSGGEKLVHVGKVVAFIVSFGFAFPTLFSD